MKVARGADCDGEKEKRKLRKFDVEGGGVAGDRRRRRRMSDVLRLAHPD